MKIGSDCSGECKDCVTHYCGGCIAGHGDDHFCKITEQKAKDMLKRGGMDSYLIQDLYHKFPELKS